MWLVWLMRPGEDLVVVVNSFRGLGSNDVNHQNCISYISMYILVQYMADVHTVADPTGELYRCRCYGIQGK